MPAITDNHCDLATGNMSALWWKPTLAGLLPHQSGLYTKGSVLTMAEPDKLFRSPPLSKGNKYKWMTQNKKSHCS